MTTWGHSPGGPGTQDQVRLTAELPSPLCYPLLLSPMVSGLSIDQRLPAPSPQDKCLAVDLLVQGQLVGVLPTALWMGQGGSWPHGLLHQHARLGISLKVRFCPCDLQKWLSCPYFQHSHFFNFLHLLFLLFLGWDVRMIYVNSLRVFAIPSLSIIPHLRHLLFALKVS